MKAFEGKKKKRRGMKLKAKGGCWKGEGVS